MCAAGADIDATPLLPLTHLPNSPRHANLSLLRLSVSCRLWQTWYEPAALPIFAVVGTGESSSLEPYTRPAQIASRCSVIGELPSRHPSHPQARAKGSPRSTIQSNCFYKITVTYSYAYCASALSAACFGAGWYLTRLARHGGTSASLALSVSLIHADRSFLPRRRYLG